MTTFQRFFEGDEITNIATTPPHFFFVLYIRHCAPGQRDRQGPCCKNIGKIDWKMDYATFRLKCNKNQYGFRKNHSTNMTLLHLTNKVTSAQTNNEFVFVKGF